MVMNVVAPPRTSRRTVVPFSLSRKYRSRRCFMPFPPLSPGRPGRLASVADEGTDLDLGMGQTDGLDALEKRELDHGAEADDLPLEKLDQVDGAHRGGPRGDEIVDDEDALAAGHRILVHLEMLDGV